MIVIKKTMKKNKMVIVVEGGIEILIDENQVESVWKKMEREKTITVGKNLIMTDAIIGVFEPEMARAIASQAKNKQ